MSTRRSGIAFCSQPPAATVFLVGTTSSRVARAEIRCGVARPVRPVLAAARSLAVDRNQRRSVGPQRRRRGLEDAQPALSGMHGVTAENAARTVNCSRLTNPISSKSSNAPIVPQTTGNTVRPQQDTGVEEGCFQCEFLWTAATIKSPISAVETTRQPSAKISFVRKPSSKTRAIAASSRSAISAESKE